MSFIVIIIVFFRTKLTFMKISPRLPALLFLITAAFSCQKDLTDPMTPVTPPVVTPYDSVTLLSRIAFVEINNSPTDTITYYDFAFDSLKRVTTVRVYDVDNGVSIPAEIYTYYYNGNDTLAWKKTEIDTDPVYGYSITYYYLYDSQQRLIKDSTLYNPEVEVHHYIYSNTMIIMAGSFTNPTDPTNSFNMTDTGYIGATGDPVKTNSLYGVDYTSSTWHYDNHPNPLQLLNIRSTYHPFPIYNYFIEDFTLQKNNVIARIDDNGSDLANYAYTYTASGYPSAVDISYVNVPVDNERLVFFYKKL